MKQIKHLPLLETPGYHKIDLGGLSNEHVRRINEVGLDKWMEEIATPKIKISGKFFTGLTQNQKKEMIMEEKQVITPAQVGKIEDILPELTAQKKPASLGKKGSFLADEFVRIATANNGVVTLDQAKAINPGAPSDLAYYARLKGIQIETEKKKGGGTTWKVKS